jgi:cell division protein FtsX
MKWQDMIRLGKISIATRKKSTRNTARGITFGLIIIIPILFFTFAFHLDLTEKINQIETIASFQVETKHYTDPSPTKTDEDYTSGSPLLAYSYLETMSSLPEVTDYLVSEYYRIELFRQQWGDSLPNSSILKIGTEEYRLEFPAERIPEDDFVFPSNRIKVVHDQLSSKAYFTKAEENDLKKMTGERTYFLAGDGFKEEKKGQVILSESILELLDLEAEDILHQQVSILYYASSYELIDNNTNPNDTFLANTKNYNGYYTMMENFEVVGILKKEIYQLLSRQDEAHIWIHQNAMYTEGESFLPISKWTVYEEDEYVYSRLVHTYASTELTDITSQAALAQKAFIPIGLGAYYETQGYNTASQPVLNTLLQCVDYRSAKKAEPKISRFYDLAYTGGHYSPYLNFMYREYRMIDRVSAYVITILLIFGGVIFFATLLNLYNSIHYSVQTRINYIGVMRAIGAKEKLIPRLYFVEMMLIFGKSFVWTLLFGGGLSYLIKTLVDRGFAYLEQIFPIQLSVQFIYFFVTLLVVGLFEIGISFLYSQIACHQVAHQPILTILKEEK